MPKCAFLSIANTEGWFIDDDLVHAPLQKLGWSVENIPWNEPTDWDTYDIVVVRSPWDYQKHLENFKNVLQKIHQSRAILLNDLETLLWNIDKNYLFELEEKGIELVPTLKQNDLTLESISKAYEVFETEEIIIKPMIGANADDTYRLKKTDISNFSDIISRFRNREYMIQPFMDSIISEGEFSLMYFNGKLSHTILKTAAKGDFRIQEEHGGGVTTITTPDQTLVNIANKTINSLPKVPFYARVDLIRTPSNSFALMELELIEPCLYFRFDSSAPQLFAKYIDQHWQANL